MKHAVLALALSLGTSATYAQQSVRMTFSGTWIPVAINQQPNSITDEEHLAGNGTFGSFTLHQLRTDGAAPAPSSNCSGAATANFPVLAGAGAFRFSDGSLLTIEVSSGGLCIDFGAGSARMAETFRITGGTGRFKGATGNLTLTGAVQPLLFVKGSTTQAILITITGQLAGTISGVSKEDDHEDDRR